MAQCVQEGDRKQRVGALSSHPQVPELCACHCLTNQGLLLEKPFSPEVFTVGPVTLARAGDELCSRILPETLGNIIY